MISFHVPKIARDLVRAHAPSKLGLILLAVPLALLGCQSATEGKVAGPTSTSLAAGQATPPGAAPIATPTEEPSSYPASKMDFTSFRGPIGSKITVTGTGFPANQEVALTWQTFDGQWFFEIPDLQYTGPRYTESFVPVGKVKSDASGVFKTDYTVPEDFGGWHNIIARVDGKYASRNAFNITPKFSVSATEGPVGTPLTVKIQGGGWVLEQSLFLVTWDNAFTGYMMGVVNKGTATGTIRIAGDKGPHVLKIWRNFRGIPFLIPNQGPFGALPASTFTIKVTDGVYNAPAVWSDPKPEDTLRVPPAVKNTGGAKLNVSQDKGNVGTKIAVQGEGFEANSPVKLTWASRTGRKITNTGLMEGISESQVDMPGVTAGADGRFKLDYDVPNDYGGPHRITATATARSAEAYFSITPAVILFTDKVKQGGEINVQLRGQDWTVQGKTYAVVYDNKFLGYVCGYSSGGYVDLHLPATGGPGPHTIDFYPSIYEGKEPTPNIYSMPDLAYKDDLSVLKAVAPVFRMTLTITE